jgi:methionine sulfoxide reductase catalytic subunit
MAAPTLWGPSKASAGLNSGNRRSGECGLWFEHDKAQRKAKPLMDSVTIKLPPHDPIASTLSAADDRIVLSHWLPPQQGIVPRIRIGRRSISILWALPIGAAALVLLIALAQSLREFPSVRAFIRAHPGIAQAAPSVDSGFPWWLQLQHFLNMLFMMFIIRAGIQILADHPRLYWNRDCTPGTEWFRFQYPVPEGRIWTSKDDSVTLPGWLGTLS